MEGGRESGDRAASGRRMTAWRKNLAAGREGRLLINAGAEAGRGARTRMPHQWHFTEAGCGAAGFWLADKGTTMEEASRGRGRW